MPDSLGFAPLPTVETGSGGFMPDTSFIQDARESRANPPAVQSADPDPYGLSSGMSAAESMLPKSPLERIGARLLNMAAAVDGTESYSSKLLKMQREQQAVDLERLKYGMNALDTSMKMIQNAPTDQQEHIAKTLGEHFAPMMGKGFGAMLLSARDNPERMKTMLDTYGRHGKTALQAAGNLKGAEKLLADDDWIKRQDELNVERNAPYIMSAFDRIDEMAAKDPHFAMDWNDAKKDGITFDELRKVAPAIGLNDDMLAAIRYSPDLQKELRPSGFVPQADADLRAKQDIEAGATQQEVWDPAQGKLRFATRKEIQENPQLQPASAKPDDPDKPKFEGGLMAVNPQSGEVLPSPVTYDGNANKYLMQDGSELPAGYIVTRANLNATKAGDLGGLSKGAQAKTENDLAMMNDSLSNMEKVQAEFRPEYLKLVPSATAKGLSFAERMGAKLSPENKDKVTRFSTYKQDSIQVVNEGIKAITGAAMTDSEAGRLTKQFANIDGDGPTEFKAKIDNAVQKTKLAIARRKYMLQHGANVDFTQGEPSISLETYQSRINKRGKELTEQAMEANPGLSIDEARKRALAQVKQEFFM